jgi:uncharacterized protein YciW
MHGSLVAIIQLRQLQKAGVGAPDVLVLNQQISYIDLLTTVEVVTQ